MIGSEPLLKICCAAQVAAKPDVSGVPFTALQILSTQFSILGTYIINKIWFDTLLSDYCLYLSSMMY